MGGVLLSGYFISIGFLIIIIDNLFKIRYVFICWYRGGIVVNLLLFLLICIGIDNWFFWLKDLVCKINKLNVCFDWFVYFVISFVIDV